MMVSTVLPHPHAVTEDELSGFVKLAKSYRLNGRYEDAIETLKQALDYAREDQEAEVLNELTFICDELTERAGEYFEKDQHEDAVSLLKQALEAAQEEEREADIFYKIAVVYDDWKRYEQAIEFYEKFLEIKRDSEDALYNIATIYAQKLEEYEKGAEYYKKYLDIRPDDPDAFFHLGVCHEKSGESEDALLDYRKAIDLQSENEIIIYENIVLYALAIRNINPHDTENLYTLGIAYQELKDVDKAIQYYEKIPDIDSEHTDAYIAIGNVYAKSEKYEKAIQYLDKALSIKDDPTVSAFKESLNSLVQKQEFEEEDTISDEDSGTAIEKPYDPSDIKVDMTPFTVFQIMRKIKLNEINLQPDFQRHIIWDDTRQSRLIESVLIRIPLPAFYLDATNDDEWMVVDGLQRLYTLDRFCNRNELKLINLEFLTELEGKTFDDLPRRFQRQIEDHTRLNFYIIQPDTPSRVKFTIFYRINTGGLILTPQEIRHSLFQGKSTDLLRQLADSDAFKAATANSIRSRRMEDRECILRALAFHIRAYTEYNTHDLHGFLCDIMQHINKLPDEELEKLEMLFTQTMHKAEAVFGDYAFRKIYQRGGQKYPINKALFEVWSVSLMKYDMKYLKISKDEIIESFAEILNTDAEFAKSISQGTGSANKVRKRFSTIENLLLRIME